MLGLFRRRKIDPDDRAALGAAGEKVARRHLKRLDYFILARNYRCQAGELDLIALDGDVIVFVEVKTRTDAAAADPSEWITPAKRRQLIKVARYYIHVKDAYNRPCRFDALSVLMRDGARPVVQHFQDAFTPD